MLSYEVLDFIADSYIPLLFLYILFLIGLVAIKEGLMFAARYLLIFFIGVVLVYFIMYLDIILQIWPSFSMDYSTHTALAIAIVNYLVVYKQQYKSYFIVSLIAYCLLMLYQQYHTVLDIVTTAVVISPMSFAIFIFGKRKCLLGLTSSNLP
ncbi:hypothetical protein [Spartinivicinus ruber]|uniref:hypothetical protein n=1 Tax=Spartinivicinus ruber TaxID=2683272 RepID=UPI0013D1466D|nr:hypothetical protein [Spartinivicinus ruber]